MRQSKIGHLIAGAVVVLMAGQAQAAACRADAPTPYGPGAVWGQLPAGRTWGSTSGITVDVKGNIWVAERCGANSCATSSLAPIMKFGPDGKLLASFGAGLFAQPHGITVDAKGNVWVSDDQGVEGKGHQVIKFSPQGKELMRLGKAGQGGPALDQFNQPTAVAIAPNGDIFVSEGHPPTVANSRITKFSPAGKFIKTWGSKGDGPTQFNGPHALAFDSKGRLFVADRVNKRVAIYSQDGDLLDTWRQFGSPSGLFIDAKDRLYVSDSSQGAQANPECASGVWVGRASDGAVLAHLPIPATDGSEGVAAGPNGEIYGSQTFVPAVKKYVRGQ